MCGAVTPSRFHTPPYTRTGSPRYHPRMLRLAVAAAASAALAAAQAPCCAYGGTGLATMIADGVIVLPGAGGAPGSRASLATIGLGAGVSARGNGFVAVIVGSAQGPEQSFAGWVIEQNASGQTLSLWYGNDAGAGGAAPTCSRSSVSWPDSFTPSVKLCCGGGGNGGAFSDYVGSYSLGAQRASWFGQNGTRSALLSVTDAGCAPVTVLGPDTPIGGGAFSLAVQGGSADAAPAAWADAPAACGF